MQFDEDTEIYKFSMFIDGKRVELIGNTESIFMELSKILKSYLLCLTLVILMTLLICSLFIAKTNTDIMLFG